MKIEAKKVEKGYFLRSIKSSIDLLLRNPIFWALYGFLFASYTYASQYIINYRLASFISIVVIGWFFIFGSLAAMLSDTEKLSFENVYKTFLLSVDCFFANIKDKYFILVVFALIAIILNFYSDPTNENIKDFKKFDYLLSSFYFNGVLFIFAVGNSINHFFHFVWARIQENNINTKYQVVFKLLADGYFKNKNLVTVFSLFPIISLLTIFFHSVIILLIFMLSPIFLYTMYREMFEDTDKNRKVKETVEKFNFNLG